jgi:SAM-dependent methyltransferase
VSALTVVRETVTELCEEPHKAFSKMASGAQIRTRRLGRTGLRYVADRRYGIHSWRVDYDGVTSDATASEAVLKIHFSRAVRSLPIAPDQFTFIDLGCGKGAALFFASLAGFRRIIGVEIVPELLDQARLNLRSATNVELVLEDAARYIPPSEPTVLFLYNPFGATTLHRVLKQRPPEFVVYVNPVHRSALEEEGYSVVRRARAWTSYRYRLSRSRVEAR